jgi:hypothetical protein
VLLDDALQLFKRLQSQDIPVQLEIYEHMFHVFHLFPMVKSRQHAIDRIAAFLSKPDPPFTNLESEDLESDHSSSTCHEVPKPFECIKISAEQAHPSVLKIHL